MPILQALHKTFNYHPRSLAWLSLHFTMGYTSIHPSVCGTLTRAVGYIAWAFFTNLILPRTRPSVYLPGIMLLWGVVTCGIGAAKTYPQLVAMRILVGALEAGLTPGMIFVFSCWYLPKEFGKRSAFS